MRTQFSKIALAAFAVNSALSMAFAGIPANCVEEIITLSRSSDFDMQKFTTNLPVAVAKAKLQAKAPFGKPKDSDKTDIGMTFGCVTAFPESSVEIASLLKDVSLKTASSAVAAAPLQVQSQSTQQGFATQLQAAQSPPPPQAQPRFPWEETQPQYVQPQEQPQYVQPQYVQPQYAQPQYMQPQEQPQFPPPDQWKKVQKLIVQNLIEDGVEKNKRKIQMESVYLSPEDIEDLYEKNKKNAGASALLGATIGLGIGSYAQGNIAMGVTQTLLDALSYLLLLIASPDLVETGVTLISISRITGAVAPFVYQSNYNETLRAALRHNSYSYSIDPLIVPKDGGAPAVGLAFNLRY